MVVVKDVMNLIVKQALKEFLINVYHMAVVKDVMNLIVKQVLVEILINV